MDHHQRRVWVAGDGHARICEQEHLPPGYGYGSDLKSAGRDGGYWSSTPYSDESNYAWELEASSSFFCRRCYAVCSTGHSVRPVRSEAGGANTYTVTYSPGANGRKMWECYVLGLDPEVATNDFRITSFPMKADGTPDWTRIEFEPPQWQWNVPATYKVKGAATLEGPWEDVPAGGNPVHRFFKVEVVLP